MIHRDLSAGGMMRIVLLAPAIEDYCIEYANALAKVADVTFIAPVRLFKIYTPFFDPSIDLRLLDWPRHRSAGNVWFILRLIMLIRSLRPDAVHFLAESVTWLNLVVPAVQKFGIVTTMHDVSYHLGDHASRRVPRRFADWLVARSDRVIVHGAALRADAERKYPYLKGKIEVLPHLQLRRYANIARKDGLRRRDDSTINVLFFGRIYAYKGLDVLIRSIPMVVARFTDVRVVIAGEGENIEDYRNMIADPQYFEIRNRRVDDDETAQVFTDADIVALPYIEASQSGVLAIANSFAKPVIVTSVGELGRSVADGVTGLVVPPNDARALADAILLLATDGALRTRLGVAGRVAAETAASPERVAEAALQLYEHVARARAT